jgi:hypothetical protein
MHLRTTRIERHHLCRRCMQCGRELSPVATPERCVGCGCDFDERPPRSYAEMEGLVELSVEPGTDAFLQWRQTVTLERWLLTAFGGALLAAFLAHAVANIAP